MLQEQGKGHLVECRARSKATLGVDGFRRDTSSLQGCICALVAGLWAEKSSTQGNGEQKSGVDEGSSPSALYRLRPWGSVTDVQSPLLRTPLARIPAASAPQRRAVKAALQHKSDAESSQRKRQGTEVEAESLRCATLGLRYESQGTMLRKGRLCCVPHSFKLC